MWGIADLHAHPMAHLGFGGHLIAGRHDGPASQLAPCNGGDHGGQRRFFWFLGNLAEAVTGQLSGSSVHGADGWPSFASWPRHTTLVHQQMHVDWIRRAYEGGLRLMGALAVHNRLLTFLMEGRDVLDDGVVAAQTTAMQRLVEANSSWMELVYSPAHARRAIHDQNKLATVLGVEVDQLEFFDDHVDLYRLGNEASNYFSQGTPPPGRRGWQNVSTAWGFVR
jgi:hypothetical protein